MTVSYSKLQKLLVGQKRAGQFLGTLDTDFGDIMQYVADVEK